MKSRLLFAVLVAGLCLPASADRGGAEYKRGEQAERQRNFDQAYACYKRAIALSPTNARYLAAYTRMRFNAAGQHLRNGQLFRSTGNLPGAMAEFQKAVEIDSSSFIAQQELRTVVDLERRQERQQAEKKPAPPKPKLPDDLGEAIELHPLSNVAITLRMTAPADVIYKTVCKLAGLNVLIDPDYRPQKFTIDLTDVTLREALDLLRLQSKTFWRPVSPNTIFVTGDSPAKRKELETNVLKTFYLQNITSPSELQEAANMVRQILDVSRVQLVQAQDALIVRGTPDQLVLTEKLLADYDKPKSEVVIDVTVMQVSRDRLRTLGTTLPTTISGSLVPNSSGGTTAGSFTVQSLGKLSSANLAVAFGGASFTALATDSNTKILQSPEIRALNDEKATLRIGDRVPIATGSFQPGIVGGGGVSPLVSTQFQYLDVGVNIDITPHIHADSEVTLKMSLEISSVTGSQDIGGITQPIIGQRRIDHEARLKDGEVNLLGGILEDSETQSMSGYPWISKVPILRYLFAQDNRDRRENEIVFAITPHIIRAQDVTEDARAIAIGTGGTIELHHKEPAPAAVSAGPVTAPEQKPPAQAPTSSRPAAAALPSQARLGTKPE